MAISVASLNKSDCAADQRWVNGIGTRCAAPLVAALTVALSACSGGGGSAPSALPPQTGGVQNQAALGSTLSPSSGTIGSGYIECDTAPNIAAGNNCNNFANFYPAAAPATGGAFVFTAIAATAAGNPIAEQLVNGSSAAFPNGAYRVVESAGDNPQIVSVSGGPWSTPGSQLSGADGSYGNHVSIACVRTGKGNLELQLVTGSGTLPLPLGTRAFASNTTTVNCSASGAITVF